MKPWNFEPQTALRLQGPQCLSLTWKHPHEWESHFCSLINSRNTGYVDEQSKTWAPLACPSIREAWRCRDAHSTHLISLEDTASVILFGSVCAPILDVVVASLTGRSLAYNNCLRGRGRDRRKWSCACCWVHPAHWCHVAVRGWRIAGLRWSKFLLLWRF